MRLSRASLLIFLTLLLLFDVSCTQRETDIGLDAVTNGPVQDFSIVYATATVGTNWNPRVSNGRGASLQVGDAANYFAFSALRFEPEVVLPESVQVDSMVIKLSRNRIWPELAASDLQVRIREIQERWVEDSLLAGYLPGRETYPILDSLLSLANDLEFHYPVPETLWSRWIASDTTTWGLLIEPKSSGTLLDFYSSERVDSIQAAIEIYGIEWRQNNDVWTDTAFYAKQAAVHDAYLAINTAECDSTRFCVSQGFPQRAAMYFPMDSITAVFNNTVVHAELTMYADSVSDENMLYSNVGLLYKDGTLTDLDWIATPDSATGSLVAVSSSLFDSTDQHITFDVTWIVAGWVAEPATNTGVQVLTSEENGHLTRQLFYSHVAEDTTKRPRLKLWLAEQE